MVRNRNPGAVSHRAQMLMSGERALRLFSAPPPDLMTASSGVLMLSISALGMLHTIPG
jgi:hypothetical protein